MIGAMTEPILGVPLGHLKPIEVAQGIGYPIEVVEKGQPIRGILRSLQLNEFGVNTVDVQESHGKVRWIDSWRNAVFLARPPRRLLLAFGPVKAKDLLDALQEAISRAGIEPSFPENQLLSPELRARLTKESIDRSETNSY